ncbi:HAD family hydrolase [Indiicoccus explosivorum]|uniref:HAD family hydrolase n=1 Tax=Indiicoccus explosivorum TaxID=1917864 RepID=UPI000B4545BC|nr:HAD family hydrolase [Indiicoccus explosivorum]
MIEAVVFDFDGLIIDTEVAWYEAYRETLASYGADLPLARFAECVGTSDDVLRKIFRELTGGLCRFEEIEAQAAQIVDKKMKEPLAREGVTGYLAEAKRLGYRIALATSSSRGWVTRYLAELELISYFEAIVTKEDVHRVKPAPDLYVKAVEALDVRPEQAVAFEDSLNGCRAAVAAGLQCVIVPSTVTAGLPFEDYALRLNSMGEKSLSDVIKLIEDSPVAKKRTLDRAAARNGKAF